MTRVIAAFAAAIVTACSAAGPEAPSATSSPTPYAAAATSSPQPPSTQVVLSAPPARGYHHLISVGERGLLMFGGETAGPALGGRGLTDTWTYRGSQWLAVGRDTAPKAALGQLAYDASAEQAILLGGAGETFEQQLHIWTYDLKADRWDRRALAPSPNPLIEGKLHGASVAYVPTTRQLVVLADDPFAGRIRTWAYDVNANTWTDKAPATAPSSRSYAAVAWDASVSRVILFGGSDRADTWAYDPLANKWAEMTPAKSPPGRQYHAMTYDPKGARMVLFGGTVGTLRAEKPFGDMWSYDARSNTWTELKPQVVPPARGWHAMAHDATTGKLVLFGGGIDRGQFKADTWLYDPDRDLWTSLP
jgi:hypothetical protein